MVATQQDGELWKYWHAELEVAEQSHKTFHKRVEEVTRRYTDQMEHTRGKKGEYNLFWSQIRTAQPAIYAQTPEPVVERRYKDADPIALYASELLERAIQYHLADGSFDAVMRNCRDDRLVVGRGIDWVRYESEFNTIRLQLTQNSPETGDQMFTYEDGTEYKGAPDTVLKDDDGYFIEEIDHEETVVDWVHPEDLLHNPARNWFEVRWVARKVYLTNEEFKERFKVDPEKVTFEFTPESVNRARIQGINRDRHKKAIVWEIWDKPSGMVFWFCAGYKTGLLDAKEDFLHLSDFFPCSPFLQSTTGNSSYIPIPDFVFMQVQLKELTQLTGRINTLTRALKLAGCYDASNKELRRLVREGTDTILIPVKDWAGFNQRGGLDGGVQFLPIAEVAEVVTQLHALRDRVKADLYEISGFGDLLRGQGDARATATAEGIKEEWGTLRIRDMRRQMAEFARCTIGKMGEIIAEHFQPETIANIAGVQIDPNTGLYPPEFEQAINLLKTDFSRDFRITIETDSTLAANKERDKEQAIEFTNTVSSMVTSFMELGPQGAALAPLYREMMLHVARRVGGGRSLEQGIEQATAQFIQQAQQAAMQPAPEDPTQQLIQMQMRLAEQEQQISLLRAQQDATLKSQAQQADQALKQQDQAFDQQLAAEKARADLGLKAQEMQMKAGIERQKIQQKAQADLQKAQIEAEVDLITEQPAPAVPQPVVIDPVTGLPVM